MEQDAAYFRRRLNEEREAAGASDHPVVRQRHHEMAEAYELRLADLVVEERRAAMHIVMVPPAGKLPNAA